MIIECKSCGARFRLDETKIKGRGARVKCRKCGDQIVVLKEPPVEDIAPPPDNLIPFPGPAARPTEAPAKDEVDLAFEALLSGPPPEPPPEPPKEEPPAWEPPAEIAFEPPAEIAFEPPAELAFDVPPAEEPAAPPPADAGFLVGDSETVEYLQTQVREADIGQGSDISLSIAETPAAAEPPLSLEPTSVAAPPDRHLPAPREEEEIALQGNVTPEAESPEIEAPPYREDEPRELSPAAAAEREPAPRPAVERPPLRIGRIAGILALAAVLGAAGFFGLTGPGKKAIGDLFPRIAALFGGTAPVKAESRYEVRERIPYYVSGAASPQILVIEGQVTNLSTAGKSGIRIHASLLDNTGNVLMEQAVFAGNTISAEKLQAADRPTLEKTMANPLGERLANMDVAPGKAVPFMVMFFDAPPREQIDSYRLEAKDAN
ncbi:MAG: zinc-ribbon domain-containing protein [Thermodesulfobacteriota bacterium]